MDKLKYVKCSSEELGAYTMTFFGEFNDCSSADFVDEFRWLEQYKNAKEIKIYINSEGGSVIRGMNVFSTILNSKTKTIACVEGLAASMGSIIIAACDVIEMRDYAKIMIHNPFDPCSYDEEDEKEDQVTKAFREMLQSIYTSRWGIDKDRMQDIMDGGAGEDGTWIDSSKAVKLGIVEKKNIIKTELQKKKAIENKLSLTATASEIADVYASIIKKDQHNNFDNPIFLQKADKAEKTKNNNMDEKINGIASILSVEVDEVVAKVAELSKVSDKVADLQGKNTSLTKSVAAKDVEISGLNASLENTQASLEEAKTELGKYKEHEAAVKAQEIDAFFEGAVAEGRVKEDAVEGWKANIEAGVDFALIKSTINSIIIPEKIIISKEIEATAGKEAGGVQRTSAEEAGEALEAERIKKLKNAGIDPKTFVYKKLK